MDGGILITRNINRVCNSHDLDNESGLNDDWSPQWIVLTKALNWYPLEQEDLWHIDGALVI